MEEIGLWNSKEHPPQELNGGSQTIREPEGFGQSLTKVWRSRPRARLNGSEIRALELFGRFPMLTVRQIMRLTGWSKSHISNVTDALFGYGMVDAGLIPEPLTTEQKRRRLPPNKPKLIYRLTNVGVRRGQREGVLGDDVGAPPPRWHGDFIGSYSDIRHRSLIIDVMIAVEETSRSSDHISVGFMKPDFVKEKRGKERVRQTKDSVGKSESITPDLVAKIFNERSGRSTLLFVEVQNSRLPPVSENPTAKSITKKLGQYSPYFDYPARRFKNATQSLALYVAHETAVNVDGESIDYVEHIQRCIDWKAVGNARGLCLLSNFHRIERGIFGPVWLNHRGETVRLVS